jgi:two-component system, NarL family, response regulator YdfI
VRGSRNPHVTGDHVVRVAIAASSDVTCARIEALLATEPDVCVVGTARSTLLAEFLEQIDADVLLLDLGSEMAEALAHVAERVELPTTILLASNLAAWRHLVDLGVRAVLANHVEADRLVAAIKAVAAGLVVLDEHAAGIENFRSEGEPRREQVETLTPRELEVLRLLAEGLPNKEIATTLAISEHTVKFHLSSIFGKLGATSRTEAVAIGIRRGLVMV